MLKFVNWPAKRMRRRKRKKVIYVNCFFIAIQRAYELAIEEDDEEEENNEGGKEEEREKDEE